LFAAVTSALSQAKPNVLLIVGDDPGLPLSCYGDKHIHTPNIGAPAASGTLFKTAYVAQSSCRPLRSPGTFRAAPCAQSGQGTTPDGAAPWRANSISTASARFFPAGPSAMRAIKSSAIC